MRPLKATGKLANLLAVLFLLTTGLLANWQTVSYAEWSATVPNPIMEYHYTYDNNGNITNIYNAVAVSTSTFTYDEVDRITSAVGPYGTQSYSYDAVGNTVDITPPATNTYDNGNIIDYNGKHIDYDYENRPVKITNADGTITEFAYDYSGERVYKKVSSGTITSEDYYVGNIYEESYSIDSSSPIISASTTTVTYVYAGSIRVAGLTSQATATGTENNTCYYHGDHLGSSSVITDGSGTVVRNISYQPWGNVHSNTEESGATTLDPNHKFTGQILDDSTDLYYYGARYYDPILRRFITPDTILQSPYDPQSLNRYAYCRNNPVILVDDSGHFFFLAPVLMSAAIGALTSGAVYSAVSLATTGNWTWGGFGQAAIMGAIGGGVSGAFSMMGTALGQNAAFNMLGHMAGYSATTIAQGGHVTGGGLAASFVGAAVGGAIPGFQGVEGGAAGNIAAELAHGAMTGAISGTITSGLSAAFAGGDIGQGMLQGAKTGAIAGATVSGLQIAAFGNAIQPSGRAAKAINALETDMATIGNGAGAYGPVYRSGGLYSLFTDRGVALGRNLVIPRGDTNTFIHETVHYYQQTQMGYAPFLTRGAYEQLFIGQAAYSTPGNIEFGAEMFTNTYLP